MRRLALLATLAVAAASLIVAIPAQAATTRQTVSATISPKKAGTSKAPKGGSLKVLTTTTNDDGSQPPVVSNAKITFPKEFRFNGKSFPVCTKAQLDSSGPSKCPKGSKVGGGSAKAQVGTAKIDASITAYNGSKSGNKIELYIATTTPGVNIQKAIEGTLSGGTNSAKVLNVPIPKDIQQPLLPNPLFSSLTSFETTVKATTKVKGKTVNFFETAGPCPKAKSWPLKGVFTINRSAGAPPSTEASYTATNKIACS